MWKSLVIVLLVVSSTNPLPQGAPTTVCETMLPYHGGGIAAQSAPTPFSIIPEVSQLAQNSALKISLGSRQGVQYGGFMIHARGEQNEIVGRFVDIPEKAKGINCKGQEDTLTHQSPEKKGVMEFIWQPPEDYLGTVVFNATVAQAYDVFWVGIPSEPVHVMKRSDIKDTTPSSGGFPTPRQTTPPHFYPTEEPQKSTGNDPFYDNCFETKGCFGSPAGCIHSRDCKVVMATTVKGDRYEFEMKGGKQAAYVAFGLSNDEKMGDDSVIECVREGNQVKAHMSRTTASPFTAIRLPRQRVQVLNYSLADGNIYCKVLREPKTTVEGTVYDLINKKYFILVATGSEVQPDKVGYHDIAKLASGEEIYLSDVSEIGAASKILLRLHGAFMLVAWVGTASVGILFARYYRQTWVGSQICGKDQWFAWHRFFMVLTWSLTMVAFALIFIELQAWSAERNPHAILGMCTTVICFLQPIGAFFRPHPGTPKRSIFNWLHWLAGNVAHILAIVTIFFAVKLSKAELPDWMDWILVAFVAFHVCMHLVLSILGCVSDRAVERRVTAFPMKDLGGINGRNGSHIERKMDAPNSGVRKFILGMYLFVIILLVTAMVVVIVLAPIEDTWKRLRNNMK